MATVSKFIQTLSGVKFYPQKPRGQDMFIEDIAVALAKQCRFNGHCRGFYSVAQHSVIVSHLVPEWCAREGLMHDAAEAWIGDLVAPVKYDCPDYQTIEDIVELCVSQRFSLVHPHPSAIKKADLIALAMEKRDLKDDINWAETAGIIPPPWKIEPLEWPEAVRLFMDRAEELGIS